MTRKFQAHELINICLLLVGILFLVLKLNTGFGDSDYYWHVTLGETICNTGGVPREDHFSWISQENGFVETAHSWLSSIILYLFSEAFGVCSGGIYAVLTACVFSGILYMLLIRELKCKLFQELASILLAVATYLLYAAARPQNIGYILFALSIYTLFKTWKCPTFSSIPKLASISLLWANLHGGTLPMLFAFELLFCIATVIPGWSFGALEHNRMKERSCLLQIFGGGLMTSLLAGLINPYGFSLYYYFFITNNAATKQYVVEWQPAQVIFPALLITVLMLVIMFVIFKHKKEFIFTLCVCATVGMAAIHVRVSNFACILAFVMLIFEADKLEYTFKNGIPFFIPMTINALMIAVVISYGLEGRLWVEFENPVTDEVIQYLADNNIERPFTGYNIGGYFIAKGRQSFIDSRADPFSSDILEDGMFFDSFAFEDLNEYDRCIEEYRFDAIIIYTQDSFKLRNYLLLRDDWNQGYISDDWEIFIPNT